jgi:hypothetical protein
MNLGLEEKLLSLEKESRTERMLGSGSESWHLIIQNHHDINLLLRIDTAR